MQIGRGMAYFLRPDPEKGKEVLRSFPGYSFGHGMADSFQGRLERILSPRRRLSEKITTSSSSPDFAPYLEKVKASGCEVIYTGDWIPDAANLLKRARQMGVKLPLPIFS